MTTKEQERKALEQIKKIIDGLGEGSYIATAMDGMIDDAEENIENDFALSWKDRAQSATKRFEKAEADLVQISHTKAHLQKKLDEVEAQSKKYFEDALSANMTIRQMEKDAEAQQQKQEELNAVIADKDKTLADRDFEIMQLKAKLYDLLNK